MGKVCERCGHWMEDGSLAYDVRIQVSADFDGVLVPPEPGTRSDAGLRELVASLSERDSDELLREVYHSERHLLCPGCRDRYLANPLNLPLPDDVP
jgi:hypothetical protein